MNDAFSALENSFYALDAHTASRGLAHIVQKLLPRLVPVWHPLGFIHVKLAQAENGDSFRLHAWTPNRETSHEQSEKIHDHLFNVHSRVIFGAVRNLRYSFQEKASGPYQARRVVYLSAGNSYLSDTNNFGDLFLIDAQDYRAPTLYTVPKFEIHETVHVDDSPALTFVHTTGSTDYQPRAIFHRSSPLPPPRTPINCDRGIWLTLLADMLPLSADLEGNST